MAVTVMWPKGSDEARNLRAERWHYDSPSGREYHVRVYRKDNGATVTQVSFWTRPTKRRSR